MIDHFVLRASSYAADIDNLVLLIGVLVGFWFLVAEGVLFGLVWKFRAKPGKKALYITGEKKSEKRWITIPHALVLLCDVAIIYGAITVWVDVKQTLPEADHTIRVVGQQWAWTFVDPGPDNELDTDDDITTANELHVTVDEVYHYRLEARDVLHSFSVPVFRLKQDAIPGRQITGWFKPIVTGTFDVQCAEMCGIGHGLMGAQIIIETPEEHAAWVAAHSHSALASRGADLEPSDLDSTGLHAE